MIGFFHLDTQTDNRKIKPANRFDQSPNHIAFIENRKPDGNPRPLFGGIISVTFLIYLCMRPKVFGMVQAVKYHKQIYMDDLGKTSEYLESYSYCVLFGI